MKGLFGENGILTNTYNYLKNNNILLGSNDLNPLITSEKTVNAKDAYFLDNSVNISANTETVLLSIKNPSANKRIITKTLEFTSEGNKSVLIRLYINNILTGTFESWDNDGVAEISTNATISKTTSIIAGVTKIDEKIGGTTLAKEDEERFNLISGDISLILQPDDVLTFTAFSENTSNVGFQLRWEEEP